MHDIKLQCCTVLKLSLIISFLALKTDRNVKLNNNTSILGRFQKLNQLEVLSQNMSLKRSGIN